MSIVKRIKCAIGIHEYEKMEFGMTKGTKNLAWTRKGKKHNHIVKTNNVEFVAVCCKRCGKRLTWFPHDT